MEKQARDIILRPVVTEKSVDLMQENKYVFKVRMDANKIDIKRAVEEIFKVKVVGVNTMRVKGKEKRPLLCRGGSHWRYPRPQFRRPF